ncbi:MAG: hypothetical protein WCP65_04350 [Bacteroidota bacterium]
MSTLQAKASLDFLNWPIVEKIKKGQVVIDGLTAQAGKITDLKVPILTLKDRQASLVFTSTAAASGSHTAVADQAASEKLWDADFKEDANYITLVAKGNKALILATGYDCTVTETVATVLPATIVGFTSTIGSKTGTVALNADPQPHVATYLFALTPPEATVKQMGNTLVITVGGKTIYITANTHHNATAEGLASEVAVSAYGLALNLRGSGPFIKSIKDVKPD